MQGDGQVLAAVVAVVDQAPGGSAAVAVLSRLDRLLQGAEHEAGVHAAAGGPADDAAGAYRPRDEGRAAEPRPGRHVGVGSAGGALPAFSRVGFRRPPSEPDVRIPAHPALHPCYAVAFAASGTGDAGSPVAVAGHGDPAGSEELDSVVPDAPPGQEPAVDGVLVQAGVALVEPAEYSPEGEVVDVAERALGDPVLEIGAPASDRRVESAQEVGECPMSRPAGQDPDPVDDRSQ